MTATAERKEKPAPGVDLTDGFSIAGMARRVCTLAGVLVLLICISALPVPRALATSLYTVTGVEVDAKEADAAKAKLKAISEAQVKAFTELLTRLGGPGAAAKAKGFKPSQIGRMMASLSVEEERTGPGRYIGKLTIKFLPKRVRRALSKAGITYVEEQSPAVVVIPVWKTADGTLQLWEDNPWRQAWLDLNAENALVPLNIPLGDLTDTQTLTLEDITSGSTQKLEAIGLRYGAEAALVAYAEAVSDNSVKAAMNGDSPVGRISFEKTYVATEGGIAAAAAQAARRFHTVMIFKWTKSQTAPSIASSDLQAVNIAVPFATLQEWNQLRAQLARTPGVNGVDVSSLSSNSALVRLTYAHGFENLQAALSQNRLNLVLVGGTWVLQPY